VNEAVCEFTEGHEAIEFFIIPRRIGNIHLDLFLPPARRWPEPSGPRRRSGRSCRQVRSAGFAVHEVKPLNIVFLSTWIPEIVFCDVCKSKLVVPLFATLPVRSSTFSISSDWLSGLICVWVTLECACGAKVDP